MSRRTDSHVHEWISLVEMSGLVLSEPVLHIHFPDGPEQVPAGRARYLRGAWERFLVQPGDTSRRRRWEDTVLFELLRWPRERFVGRQQIPDRYLVRPDDVDDTLRPTAVLASEDSEPLIGLWSVPAGQGLDRVESTAGRWRATPQAKLERWMRGLDLGLGLLTNGRSFRLVHIPPGLPAAWIEFAAADWLDDKPVLDGFFTLLAADRFFGPKEHLLATLVEESQRKQTELTDALSRQVRDAVEKLILALDRADRRLDGELLADIAPDTLYRAAVYVVMRLVFLLFAEERGLLPHGNVFYDEGYGLGRLLHSLEEERRQTPETFRRECDAWPRLLGLFRLVFQGGRHPDLNTPAYGGDLFDPEAFRAMQSLEHQDLRIPNADTYAILRALSFGEARIGRERISQRYSYRTLDVEHIGYLYEGLLDHRAGRAGNQPMVKLRNGTEEAHSLTELERREGDELVDFLASHDVFSGDRERIREHLENPSEEELKILRRLHSAVAERCRPYAGVIQGDEVVEPGRFYLTTSASRRSTGTHYTPIQYTRAIVAETMEPLVHEGEDGKLQEPRQVRTPQELLALKVCDPAMGSGAFLVQVVRYLADKLVDAWWERREQHGDDTVLYLPHAEPAPKSGSAELVPVPAEREEADLWARRIVVERCIYGVDKNPLATEMAKLSLWLVTLDPKKAFSFVDHALKSGDSLLGLSELDQLRTWSLDGEGDPQDMFVDLIGQRVDRAVDLRREIETSPVDNVADAAAKDDLNRQAEAQLESLRTYGDLLIASAIGAEKASDQERLRLTFRDDVTHAEGKSEVLEQKTRQHLGGHQPFHWTLEFPEVFHRGGFDAILGNPPFMGGQKITGAFGKPYREYLVEHLAAGARGSADLVAYFFHRAYGLLRPAGNFGLLAVNTIAEGDTRQVGLEKLLERGAEVYSSHPNEPWPNQAAVVTSRVHVHKGSWDGDKHLSGETVPRISAFLTSRREWSPERLAANKGIAFQGSIVLGMGFVLEEEDALSMIERDPKNREVLFPYLNGRDLNSYPDQKPSRWVINFWDWPLEKAREYEEPFAIVEAKVKPQRMENNRKTYRDYWWHFAEKRPALYHAIGRGHHFVKHPNGWDADQEPLPGAITFSLVSKFYAPAIVSNDIVYSHLLGVVASGHPASLGLLASCVHVEWAWKQASRMKRDLRYTPSDCFETFPLPPADVEADTRLQQLGRSFDSQRRSVNQQREIGLTSLYNLVHDPSEQDSEIEALRELQADIDEAVLQAYGWADIDPGHDFHEVDYLPESDRTRFTISPSARLEILDRLTELNRERYLEEQGREEDGAAPTARSASAATLRVARRSRREDSQQADLFEADEERPPRRKVAEESSPPPAPDSPVERLRSWFRSNDGWHARGDAVEALELSEGQWRSAIDELLEAGEVERKGRKRGTKYRAIRDYEAGDGDA